MIFEHYIQLTYRQHTAYFNPLIYFWRPTRNSSGLENRAENGHIGRLRKKASKFD